VFFFEKKNQKTFTLPPFPRPDTFASARTETDKSFLVLFFKKEQFLTPLGSAQPGVYGPRDVALRRAGFAAV
jgi:hypothetical protein